jgi:hypothetical protein
MVVMALPVFDTVGFGLREKNRDEGPIGAFYFQELKMASKIKQFYCYGFCASPCIFSATIP